MLGVPGLIGAWRRGNVTLANAVGTGVADDKAVYAYMPRIIRYYLGEDADPAERRDPYLPRDGGAATTRSTIWRSWWSSRWASPAATASPSARARAGREMEAARAALLADPANWISQPVIALSVAPTLTEKGIAPRHLDLRPFAVTGRDTWVLPGGLSRVAMKEGSLVVNSSQGGGSKDTWVLADGVRRDGARGAAAGALRRGPVLDGALPGARREPGAADRRHADVSRAPGARRKAGTRWSASTPTRRRSPGAATSADADAVQALLPAGPRQPDRHPGVAWRRRATTRARCGR